MQKHRRLTGRGIFPTAGWLFADLLLAMMMIFLVASGIGTYNPQTAKPTPTPTPPIKGIGRTPLAFSVFGDPFSLEQGNPGTISTLRKQVTDTLTKNKALDRKVGFVLTFGGGPQGQSYADALNTKVLNSILSFQGAVFRKFHDLNDSPQQFELELYFFV